MRPRPIALLHNHLDYPLRHRTLRWRLFLGGVLVFVFCAAMVSAEDGDPFQEQRRRMVDEDIAGDSGLGRTAVRDSRVIEAMRRVPRHEFVPDDLRDEAYADRPLPIGYGQTISQPYIVASMTELLKLEAEDKVLEVGTGSGYQAAILAEVVDAVYTIEIIPELAKKAHLTLERLGYTNVTTRSGDGYHGWPEHGPFDGIIVTAASSHIPPPLLEQLKPGGRMVIPVGPPMQVQQLMLIQKDAEGRVTQRSVMAVQFVPLTRSSRTLPED